MVIPTPKITHEGFSFVFTYPFPIYIKPGELSLREMVVDGTKMRVYPFFRSAPANFVPSPLIDPGTFPYRDDLKVRVSDGLVLPSPAMISVLGLDKDGKTSAFAAWGTETDDRFPKDSFRVDVLSVDEARGQLLAERTSQDLLETVRVLTNQYWIGTARGGAGRTATFEIDRRGVPTPTSPCLGTSFTTVTGDEVPIDSQIWNSALERLMNRKRFYPFLSLILDSRQSLALGNVRRAILDSAIACEQARDIAFGNLWNRQNPGKPYRHSKACKSNDLTRHISEDLFAMSAHTLSYELVDPDSYIQIKRLWQVRNNVAHGKAAFYFENDREFRVDPGHCKELITAANRCCRWLLSIAEPELDR